jgi:hypothetical protein
MHHAPRVLVAAATPIILSSCLLTSPYWNQLFKDHTKPVPLQAFTIDQSIPVRFECAKAYHGGLYPTTAQAVWVLVGSTTPASQPLLDSDANKVHGARKLTALPATCWRKDANGIWFAAARATQNTTVLDTGQKYFYTFTKTGLECVGRENGKSASWFGWIGKGCELSQKHTIFRATS